MHVCKFLCIFVAEMKARILFLSWMLFCTAMIWGETVTLRSGKVVTGQVLVQNEDVVIIRDVNGARFQFPMSDVISVATTDESEKEETKVEEDEVSSSGKKAALTLEIGGGMLYEHQSQTGGYMGADLLIGSRSIKNKSITLGGSVGYLGAFLGGDSYHFLPICIAMRMPLLEGKHAPLIGASMGYGIALGKNYKGGLNAQINVAYRYAMSSKSALTIGLDVRFQQAQLPVVEMIEDTEYAHVAGRNLVTLGVKMGFQF